MENKQNIMEHRVYNYFNTILKYNSHITQTT